MYVHAVKNVYLMFSIKLFSFINFIILKLLE